MPKFLTDSGSATTADDPSRVIWYGNCGYWTDDWEKIALVSQHKIPCCPQCNVPGFRCTAGDWWEGAQKQQELPGESGYVLFVEANKEKCLKGRFSALWKAEKENRATET